VPPHYRSAPDGDPNNNWSSEGNVNPYTGEVGTRALVAEIQRSLILVGEDPGPVDGILGPMTGRAFASFAKKQGTTELPVVTTLARLAAYVHQLNRPTTANEETPLPDKVEPPSNAQVAVPGTPTFTIGSTAIEVLSAQGQPDRVKDGEWHYGSSRVRYSLGGVAGWSEVDVPLKTR
jgi:peptidoglycan hydrolase-like protein with peptidoglycan-binding domain